MISLLFLDLDSWTNVLFSQLLIFATSTYQFIRLFATKYSIYTKEGPLILNPKTDLKSVSSFKSNI